MKTTVTLGCVFCFISLMAVFSDIWGTGNNFTVFLCFAGCAGMAVILGILFLAVMVSCYDLGFFDALNRRNYDRESEPGAVMVPELPMTIHDRPVIEFKHLTDPGCGMPEFLQGKRKRGDK